MSDLIVKGAGEIKDGLYNIKDGKLFKYKANGGTVRTYPIVSAGRPKWIPVSWHETTEEERAENGYPKNWVVLMDCEMPSDEQEILVTTRYGTVEKDVCYEDGEFSLDSGYDWIDDILAWMPLPEAYREDGEEE